jgi:hypothetical protein
LEVHVVTRDDQERTSRRDRYDGRDGPIAEKFLGKTVSVKLSGLVDTTEYEAVAPVKQRVGALQLRIIAVLGRQRGLQVSRVVDRMRIGVGGQKLVVMGEDLAQVAVKRL